MSKYNKYNNFILIVSSPGTRRLSRWGVPTQCSRLDTDLFTFTKCSSHAFLYSKAAMINRWSQILTSDIFMTTEIAVLCPGSHHQCTWTWEQLTALVSCSRRHFLGFSDPPPRPLANQKSDCTFVPRSSLWFKLTNVLTPTPTPIPETVLMHLPQVRCGGVGRGTSRALAFLTRENTNGPIAPSFYTAILWGDTNSEEAKRRPATGHRQISGQYGKGGAFHRGFLFRFIVIKT